jgi:hypothetical protein
MRIVFPHDPAIKNELIRPVAAHAVLRAWLRAMLWTAFPSWHGAGVDGPGAILREP